jgi:MFS family permease
VDRNPAPRSAPDWRTKGVVLLSSVPLALAFSSVAPILPKMSRELAHTPTDQYLVKMMLGVVGIAMVIGAPLAGLLADKVSRRLILAVAGIVFTAAGFAPFILDNLPLMLVMRLLMGLAAQTAYIVGVALVAEAFEGVERARWMGICTTVAIAGGLIDMLLSGVLGDAGWRWPFLTYLVGAPIAAFGWFALDGGACSPSPTAVPRTPRQGRFPIEFAALGLLIGFVTYAPSIYLPFHLAALGTVRASLISRSLMLSMSASIVASSQFGRARTWLSPRAAFSCSFAAAALGIGMIAFARSYPVVLGGLFVMGLGSGWLTPNLMASAASAAIEGQQGRALGVVKAAYSLAPAVGVTLLEPIARRVGTDGVLLLTAVLAATAWLATLGAGLQAPGRWRAASEAPLE